MILQFDTENTFRSFIRSGILNLAELSAPIESSASWPLDVRIKESLPSSYLKEAKHLGVRVVTTSDKPLAKRSCWFELLELEDAEVPASAVLFTLPTEKLESFVGSFLHLDCLVQKYAVVGELAYGVIQHPPTYLVSMWRKEAQCFVEAKPRLWLPIGKTLVDLDCVSAPRDRDVLVGPSNWAFLNLDWKDLFEIVEFKLPSSPTPFVGDSVSPFEVSLRLEDWRGTPKATLWVIREGGPKVLESWVTKQSDEMLRGVFFAVFGDTVVLQSTRASSFPFETESYYQSPALHNLYLPEGRVLSPPLSPQRLEESFKGAADVFWMRTDSKVESLPSRSFRPISEWVKYVVSINRDQIATWVEDSIFRFQPWTARDRKATVQRTDDPDLPPPPSKPEARTRKKPVTRRAPGTQTPDTVEVADTENRYATVEETAIGVELCDSELDFSDPRTGPLWVSAGEAYLQQNDDRNALCCFSRAIWAGVSPESIPTGQRPYVDRVISGIRGQSSFDDVLTDPALDARSRWLLASTVGGDLLPQQVKEVILQSLGSTLDLPKFVRQYQVSPESLQVSTSLADSFRWFCGESFQEPSKKAYLEHIFAWCFAKTGDVSKSQEILLRSGQAIPDSSFKALFVSAFQTRCHQAAIGLPTTVSLPDPPSGDEKDNYLYQRWNNARASSRILESNHRSHTFDIVSFGKDDFASAESMLGLLETRHLALQTSGRYRPDGLRNFRSTALAVLRQVSKLPFNDMVRVLETLKTQLSDVSPEFALSSFVSLCYQYDIPDLLGDALWLTPKNKEPETILEFSQQLRTASPFLKALGCEESAETMLRSLKNPSNSLPIGLNYSIVRHQVFGEHIPKNLILDALSAVKEASPLTFIPLMWQLSTPLSIALSTRGISEISETISDMLPFFPGLIEQDLKVFTYPIKGFAFLEGLLLALVNDRHILSEWERSWIKKDEINLLRGMNRR